MKYRATLLSCGLALAGFAYACAKPGAPSQVPSPAASESAAPEPAASSAAPVAEAPKELPKSCEDASAKVCTPGADFAKRLCNGFYPDVALAMFAKQTPWTRAYLNRQVKGWNASGGNSSMAEIPADEEVLVLFERKANTGGMMVSGASGGFDVLRWDGTCVSLGGEELSMHRPGKPKFASIQWRKLDEKTREALLNEQSVLDVYKRHRKECKGVSVGEVSLPCVKAEADFNLAVVNAIRGGVTVPPPANLP